MKIKFKDLFRENYYKTLSTICLAAGLSSSSYIGLYVKDIVFGEDTSHTNLRLCLVYLGFGIMMLGIAIFFSFKIDAAKGVRKNES